MLKHKKKKKPRKFGLNTQSCLRLPNIQQEKWCITVTKTSVSGDAIISILQLLILTRDLHGTVADHQPLRDHIPEVAENGLLHLQSLHKT